MRYVFCLLFLSVAVLFPHAPAHAGPYYFYTWSSPKPVNPASIRITVEGGTIASNYIAEDRMWGTVNMDAPRECLMFTWRSETESGIPMYDRVIWDFECDRVFVPLLATTANSPIWHP